MTFKRRLFYWFPTLVWAGIIYSFSSLTTPSTSRIFWQDFLVKKSAHVTVYMVLTGLVYRSLKNTTSLTGNYLLLTTLCLVILYAISDEFHQSFTPGREPTLRDAIIDSVSSFVALKIIPRLDNRLSSKKTKFLV